MGYKEVYASWKADPDAFWLDAAEAIDWDRKPTRALNDRNAPLYEWLDDGLVNTCWNAVDRHVEAGRGNQDAIIHDSPVTGTKSRITYAELRDRVARLAGALAAKGVSKGDRVIVYMPMIPEALVAMLACARLGAIHSVVFGGFAANELAVRIDDAAPKAIIAGSCGIEPGRIVEYKPLLDAAIDIASHKPEFCVIFQREQARAAMIDGRDLDWDEVQDGVTPAECVPVEGSHPAYILYTSGTTGAPKGVVRPTAGHLVALNWTMKNIYDADPGDVFWAASDVGWVVGHSYICYAPLIHGNTTIVFEGKPVGTPDAGTFWRVIQEHGVKILFTAPTAFRAIKREDPNGELIRDYDLSGFKILFLAGERADPDTIEWARKHLGVPVIDRVAVEELADPEVEGLDGSVRARRGAARPLPFATRPIRTRGGPRLRASPPGWAPARRRPRRVLRVAPPPRVAPPLPTLLRPRLAKLLGSGEARLKQLVLERSHGLGDSSWPGRPRRPLLDTTVAACRRPSPNRSAAPPIRPWKSNAREARGQPASTSDS